MLAGLFCFLRAAAAMRRYLLMSPTLPPRRHARYMPLDAPLDRHHNINAPLLRASAAAP